MIQDSLHDDSQVMQVILVIHYSYLSLTVAPSTEETLNVRGGCVRPRLPHG